MAIPQGVWGIDLGQCALKAIRLEQIDGQVTATAFDYVEHPKILSQPDADPDQLSREALEKFLSRNNLEHDQIAISIPGQSGLARFVKLPPVEEKKIPDIVRFEAKQQIPFNLEEVVWDYQKLNTGEVTDGFAMETEIGLFAIKRETVSRYLAHFKQANIEVHIVQMAPLALCNFVSYDIFQNPANAEGKAAGSVVVLDIGVDNSNLVVTDGGRIIWQRPIPLGGNHFTRALTKDMKLTFAKAEHLKRNATKSPELKQILSSLRPVLNDFVGEVQRSLGYFTNTHRNANIQYMIGLGSAFRLPGLQKFISEKLQLEIRKLQRFDRLTGDEVINSPVYNENLGTFAVAYGLALQGLKAGRLQTNLLPQEIRMERLIRAKKPWVLVTAACMLLGCAALAFGYNQQYRAYAAEEVQAAMKQCNAVKQTADSNEAAYKTVLDKIDADKKAVKSVLIGQDEKKNWLAFDKFINDALPRPDGSNLSDVKPNPNEESPKKRFWGPLADAAFKRYRAEYIDKSKPGDNTTPEEEWRGDLIQANIESMYCIYGDPAAFLAKLKASPQVQMDTMRKEDAEKAPEGKAWIVELHGYTYHKNGFQFVREVVVPNLARYPLKTAAAPADASATAAAPAATGAAPAATTAAPAAPPAPAAPTPPAPAPAPAAGATAAAPAGDASAPAAPTTTGDPAIDNHPIWNKISHVVLYHWWRDTNPQPGVYQILSQRAIEQLSSGGGARPGGGGGGGGGMSMSPEAAGTMGGPPAGGGGGGGAAPAGPLGAAWAPLAAGGSRGPSMGPGGGMGGDGRGMSRGPINMLNMAGPEGDPAGLLRPPTGAPGAPDTKNKSNLVRTEFIIMFIWREPTPSDQLAAPTP